MGLSSQFISKNSNSIIKSSKQKSLSEDKKYIASGKKEFA